MGIEKQSDEDQQAQKDADAYFQENHPDMDETSNIYASLPIDQTTEESSIIKKPTPGWVTPVGAGVGAYGAYKGVGTGILNPGTSVFAPVQVEPKPVLQTSQEYLLNNPYSNPELEEKISNAEARAKGVNKSEPMTGLSAVENAPKAGALPTNENVAPETFQSKVDKVLESMREKGEPTGRQMESGHNWETNRQKLATAAKMKLPGAAEALVEFDKMYPLTSGIGVKPVVGREIEEEVMRKKAEQQVREQEAKEAQLAKEKAELEAAAKAKSDAEAQAKVEREQAAAEAKAHKEQLDKEAKLYAQKTQEQEKSFIEKSAKRAARQGAIRGAMKGVGKVGLGAFGGAEAGENFWDMYQEYKKKGWSDEAIAKALEGVGNAAMAIPNPFTQVGGNALAGYQEYKKHGWNDEAIAHALSGTGAAMMAVPTPWTELGGLALTGAGMAYPYLNPDIRRGIKSKDRNEP